MINKNRSIFLSLAMVFTMAQGAMAQAPTPVCTYPFNFPLHVPIKETIRWLSAQLTVAGPATLIETPSTPVPNPLQTNPQKRIFLVSGTLASDGATTVTLKASGAVIAVAEFAAADTVDLSFSGDVPACTPELTELTIEQTGAATVDISIGYVLAD